MCAIRPEALACPDPMLQPLLLCCFYSSAVNCGRLVAYQRHYSFQLMESTRRYMGIMYGNGLWSCLRSQVRHYLACQFWHTRVWFLLNSMKPVVALLPILLFSSITSLFTRHDKKLHQVWPEFDCSAQHIRSSWVIPENVGKYIAWPRFWLLKAI